MSNRELPKDSIEVVVGSELPDITNVDNCTLLGYENKGTEASPVLVTGKADLAKLTPLFGITQSIASGDTTHAVSSDTIYRNVTLPLEKKASKVNTRSEIVVYSPFGDLDNITVKQLSYLIEDKTTLNSNSVNFSNLSGYYFIDSEQVKLRNKELTSIVVDVSTSGTFSVMVATDVGDDNYTPTVLQTFNVGLGVNILTLENTLTLSKNEFLGFGYHTDTALFKTATGTTTGNFIFKRDGTWRTVTNGMLGISVGYRATGRLDTVEEQQTTINQDLYIDNTLTELVKKQVIGTNVSTNVGEFYYTDETMSLIRDKAVKSVTLDIATVGTFSIVRGVDVGLATFSKTTIKTFNVVVGSNTLVFDEDVVFASNERIGFQLQTDTATFNFQKNAPDGYVKNFTFLDSGTWRKNPSDSLNIQINGIGKKSRIEVLEEAVGQVSPKLKGKKISILGDSISTFSGTIPSGFVTYYPQGDVTSFSDHYIGQILAKTGMILEVNNSYSGSRVSSGDTTRIEMSAESRLSNLGNPDIILFFGGTNDFGQTSPITQLGEYSTNGFYDRSVFRQAYAYTLTELKKRYPKAIIIACTPLQRARYNESPTFPVKRSDGVFLHEFAESIRHICDINGVPYVDLYKSNMTYWNSNQTPASVGSTENLFSIDGLHAKKVMLEIMANLIINTLDRMI